MKKQPANHTPAQVSRRTFCGAAAGSLFVMAFPMTAMNQNLNAAENAENIASETIKYPCFSGIYPHLANFNYEGECGTGAVVPWAGKLWMITYAPHAPYGSSDKLYEVFPNLDKVTRPESIGGTPANRMIHPESKQLFIGPYVIDNEGNVRVIGVKEMPGRHTGNARHLTDPENMIYCGTMEEGLYEINVHTLAVKQLYCDSNGKDAGYFDILPGYHGKGLYSAQGRVVYANNGEQSAEARKNPDVPSGCLGQWNGKDKEWEIVLRNQFTEVTGPGGILGSHPDRDTLWSIGWDYRSLILMVLDNGTWYKYRLPKTSHCYDGAHGWNTEWPRIREIGDPEDLLMTMHGQFWYFPASFTAKKACGIRPRATYLKVVGDFCRWNDRLVFGCDDTAKSEFLNKSPFKGTLSEPGQSNSNLWFLEPEKLDTTLGTPIGRGAVWFKETVEANAISEAFLFAGWDRRSVHLKHDAGKDVTFRFEIDRAGNGTWEELRTVTTAGDLWVEFPADTPGEWIRVSASEKLPTATCMFQYAMTEKRPATERDNRFEGIAKPGAKDVLGGLFWVRSDNQHLAVISQIVKDGKIVGEKYYELDENSKLVRFSKDYGGGEAGTIERIKPRVAISTLPENVYRVDGLSVVCTYEGQEYRLPIACEEIVKPQVLPLRLDREVATERDLFHCAGMFYEMPAVNAGGLAKIRPVGKDGRLITDYASYRGLMIFGGIDPAEAKKDATTRNPHIIVSEDGDAALWAGVIEDLWAFGKPAGRGYFWKETAVKAGEYSLPFLMAGFDKKTLMLTNHGTEAVSVTLETDITATGIWSAFNTLNVPAGETVMYEFPAAFNSYWFRAKTQSDARMTGELQFE